LSMAMASDSFSGKRHFTNLFECFSVDDAEYMSLRGLCAAACDIIILARGVEHCTIHALGV